MPGAAARSTLAKTESSICTAAASSSSSTDQYSEGRPLCRFFFLQGTCKHGDNCSYSHTLPENTSFEDARRQIPCPYYAKGCCRYGDYCQLRHDPQDLVVSKVAGRPSSLTKGADNISTAVCGICLEDVKQAGHKFGLLSCCLHVFCFECIMEWRKEGSKEAEDRRSCPTCRKKSDWVIPSTAMATTEKERDRISKQYRDRLGRIPCKRFNGKLGSCPYGKDCFYAHISSEDGKDCRHADHTMKQLYEERCQLRTQRRVEYDIEMISRAMRLMDLYAYRGLDPDFEFYDSDLDSDDYIDSFGRL